MLATTSSQSPADASNLVRSTDSALLDAQARLEASSHRELREIQCELVDRALYLRGQVRSYTMKQLAQECMLSIDGVKQVINQIEVVDDSKS